MWVITMTSGKEQEDIVSIHTHNIDIKNREIYLHSHIVDSLSITLNNLFELK